MKWLSLLWLLTACSPALAQTPGGLIELAGNAEDESARQKTLEQLALLPAADAALRAEASALAGFIETWNKSGLKFYGKQWDNYDFKLGADSPLRPIAALYQGRMRAWTLIENSTIRSSPVEGPKLHQRASADFRAAQQAFPKNRIPGMYLGQSIPWTKRLAAVHGAPEWAVLQREQTARLREIILWWIEHRQRPDGQFGGGWGDDCEMWRWWASVLIGFDDPPIRDAQLKFSRAAMARINQKGGFNPEITDVEHAAEDTTDNLVPLLLLDRSKNLTAWQTGSHRMGGMLQQVWTGLNERKQIQFKSFYFSATATAAQPQRAFDVIANIAALHPTLLLWQQGQPMVGEETLLRWLDTWVDATARAENGKPAGILPAAIRWPDGAVAGADGNWWEPVKPGGFMHSYYIWPSVITELTDVLAIASAKTGEDKYLNPLRSMAAIRLKHLKDPQKDSSKPGTEAWCAAQLGPRENANSNFGALVKSLVRCKALTGTREFDELIALEDPETTMRLKNGGREEIISALRASAAALRVNFPGFTGEVRSTDRCMRFSQFLAQDYQFDDYKSVTLPKHELLYRMITGDTNAPRFPLPAVRWLTPCQDLAAFVTTSTTTAFEAELFHFGAEPRPLAAELRLLKKGRYRVELLVEGEAMLRPDLTLVSSGEGAASIDLNLPARRACVLKIVAKD
ncbi:MAG TPA: hypothetical protein VD994_16055 [Prosthecobacter sp.]|nr:hypothetical protein [Prosthecobacter sp.]